jgi:hypothetical protein
MNTLAVMCCAFTREKTVLRKRRFHPTFSRCHYRSACGHLDVGDKLLLLDSQEVVGVEQLAILDEEAVSTKPRAVGEENAFSVRRIDLHFGQDREGWLQTLTATPSGTSAVRG